MSFKLVSRQTWQSKLLFGAKDSDWSRMLRSTVTPVTPVTPDGLHSAMARVMPHWLSVPHAWYVLDFISYLHHRLKHCIRAYQAL